MDFLFLTRQNQIKTVVFAIAIGLALSFGFIPAGLSLYQSIAGFFGLPALAESPLGKLLAFPALAIFFNWSFPNPKKDPEKISTSLLIKISTVPILISFIYGIFRGGPSLKEVWVQPSGHLDLLWFLVLIPIGEEFLFRGWLFRLSEKLWPGQMFTATNPLPTSIWISALAFSLWHVQNLSHDGSLFVLFQMSYTLVVGWWLGFLRFRTGGLLAPIAGHFLLNLACSVF